MIQQGHKYSHFGVPVIALETVIRGHVRVAAIEGNFLARPHLARWDKLQPMPMKYFQGDVK